MKVKELIELLKELDPETLVVVEPNHTPSLCAGLDKVWWVPEEGSRYGDTYVEEDVEDMREQDRLDGVEPQEFHPAILICGVS